LTEDAKFEATYVTQYSLTLASPTWENGTRTGWYDKDSVAQLPRVTNQVMNGPLGVLGCNWRFQGWYENGKLLAGPNDAVASMDRPYTLTAHYQPDYTPLIRILILVVGAASVVMITAVMVRVHDWRAKIDRTRSLLQAKLSSARRRRGAAAFVTTIVLTVLSVSISLSLAIITVIFGRKEEHIITWRETESPRRGASVTQIVVAKIDVSGILDPVTGTGFGDGESAWRCTNCQMFYHDQTYYFLRDQNSSRCVGCGQSRLERSSVGKIEAVPIRPEMPARGFEFDSRLGFRRGPRQQLVFEPPVVRLHEVAQYVGHVIYFQGKVVEVQKSRSTETYCVKFQRGPWPHVFKLVIFPNYVDNFRFGGQTIRDYEHKTIRVRGLIQDHPEWGLEIIVNSENAITVVD